MKLKDSFFNEETGQSEVVLVDRFGTYIGKARLHPDDKDNASKYAGCRIAEYRAWIKALKSRRRRAKIKLEAIISLEKDIIQVYSDSCESALKRIKFKKIDYEDEIDQINQDIKAIEQAINLYIKYRDRINYKRAKGGTE